MKMVEAFGKEFILPAWANYLTADVTNNGMLTVLCFAAPPRRLQSDKWNINVEGMNARVNHVLTFENVNSIQSGTLVKITEENTISNFENWEQL